MVTGNRAATVIDLRERRIERLSRVLTPFLEAGHVVVETDEVDSVDEWRAAARSAARREGWRVRTGLGSDESRVWAVRVDIDPSIDQERSKMLGALNALSAQLDGNNLQTHRRRAPQIDDLVAPLRYLDS